MRTRWKVNSEFIFALACLYSLGWIPAFLGTQAAVAPHGLDSRVYPAAMYVLGGWFGVVLVPVTIYGLYRGAASIWKNRPRRVTEPLLTDLRKVSR